MDIRNPIFDEIEIESSLKINGSFAGLTPIGTILPWFPGYESGGFNPVLCTNDISSANAYLNTLGWAVCDGSEFLDTESPLFNTPGCYLPNLLSDRFLHGVSSIGSSGGSNSINHSHSCTSNVYIGNHTNIAVSNHATTTHSGAASSFNKSSFNTNQYGHYHRFPQFGWDGGTIYGAYTYRNYYLSYSYTTDWSFTQSTVTGLCRHHADTSTSTLSWASSTVTCSTTQPGSHTFSAHSFSQNITPHVVNNNTDDTNEIAVDNRPKYLNCFYIIKVK